VVWEYRLTPKRIKRRDMSAMDWKEATKYLWRPDFCPRLGEWVADFALVGQAGLESPEYASHMALFRLYYLGMAPYENAGIFSAWASKAGSTRRKKCAAGSAKSCCAGACSRRGNILAMHVK
jgi:hypothetical protein